MIGAELLPMLLGAVVGMIITPGAILLPLGRIVRALVATAAAESGFSATASGDDGQSLGILQFNAVNNALIPGDGSWRLSPFWSGVAAIRYSFGLRRSYAEIWPLFGPEATARVAWRSLWLRGDARRGTPDDVGRIFLGRWGGGQPYWLLTVAQYAILGVAGSMLPFVTVYIVLYSVVWAIGARFVR